MASAWMTDILYQMVNDYLNGKTLQVLLVTTTDTLDNTADTMVSDVSGDEISGGNYSRKTLSSVTVSENANSHAVKIDAADVTWTALTGHTIEAAYVFIDDASGDATSRLIARLDGANITTNGGDVTVKFHSTDGIAYINA